MQKKQRSLKNKYILYIYAAVFLLVTLLLQGYFPVAGGEKISAAAEETAAQETVLEAYLETRTHLVTVPAVLTLDVVISGGSGQYRYRWICLYEEEKKTGIIEDPGYSSHQEIYVSSPGDLVIQVIVTDLQTNETITASTDRITTVDKSQWRWDTSMEQEKADEYYTLLMEIYSSEENPMENENFTGMLVQRYKEQNFTDTQISQIIDVLEKADALYRDLYLLSFYNYTMFGMQGTGSGYTDPPNAAFVSANSNPKSFTETYFHEAGHGIHMSLWNLIDHPILTIKTTEGWKEAAQGAGNTELEEQVMEALTQDIRDRILFHLELLSDTELDEDQMNRIADALVNGDGEITETVGWWEEQIHASVKDDPVLRKYYLAVREELSEEISKIPYSNSNMVGDIYGGMTNNKLQLPYGHSGDYWYTENGEANGMQICESWAEFFSAKIRNDTYYMKKNTRFFPTATEALEELAAELKSDYKECLEK